MECITSAVSITELPEILYVDRHPEANKLGKRNVAVEPKEHKEKNMGENPLKTTKSPNTKK